MPNVLSLPNFLSSGAESSEDVGALRIISRDEDGFERIAFAEIILPDNLNTYGDFHTQESVREFSYSFMINRTGWDVEHDEVDISDKVQIVESFIARKGDPDFIEGAWVLGIHVPDDEIWASILSGDLNGYSYGAVVRAVPVDIEVDNTRVIYGQTVEDPFDKHTHSYVVVLSDDGRVMSGGTSVSDGHAHTIEVTTHTERTENHTHIFNIIQGLEGGI